MNDNKRSQEALSLRLFFDEQIFHLQHLIDDLSSSIHEQTTQAAEDRQLVEDFVDAANKKMRAVPHYVELLREPIRALYRHILEIAEQIPPPLLLNQDTFKTDPVINAMFIRWDDIEHLVQADADLLSYYKMYNKYQVPMLYALLTAIKHDKRTLGLAMQGDLVVHDVIQEVVNFSAYKVHTPCATPDDLKIALKKYLFDRIVGFTRQELLQRMLPNSFADADHSYESRVASLANPEVYLKTLIQHLDIPSNLLSIEKTHVKLSKLGIKLAADDQQSANEFDLYELVWNGSIRNVVLQFSYVR